FLTMIRPSPISTLFPYTTLFRSYYGTSSGSYQFSVDVGNVTSYRLSGLLEGQIYYLATTAYNSKGIESDFSNEVSTAIGDVTPPDRKSTRLNSSHQIISYAVFCL